jgi:four helix bundle protein
MRDYKKYEVWIDLLSQIKRATYSIPLNIVKGCERSPDKDFAHFLDTALPSAQEAEYCALLSFDLGYLKQDIYEKTNQKYGEVKAMLIGLIKSIRK